MNNQKPKRLGDAYLVPSETKDGVTYVVYRDSGWHCTCPAGQHNKPCKHVRHVLRQRDIEVVRAEEHKQHMERMTKLMWG